MESLIETYRTYEIKFNTDKETFYAVSLQLDNEQTKKSYASVKKAIDDFIKENNDFKPFEIQGCPTSYRGSGQILKVIGIRKDGAFVFENKKGEKGQLSKYYEKDYMLYNPENDVKWEYLALLEKEFEAQRKRIEDYKKTFISVGLETIKAKYSI